MSSRTNLKLQLQREQAQRDDDRKGNGVPYSSSTGSLSSSDGMVGGHPYSPAQHRGSPLLRNPNNSPSLSMSSTVPSSSEFQQHYSMSLQSRLEHPNRFFGDDKPKQLKTYVSNSMGRASPLTLGNSLPNQLSMGTLRQHSLNNTASPLTPDSPMTPRSVGTPHSPAITDVSEMDELIEDIMELEAKSGGKPSRNSTRSLTPKEQLAKAMKSTSPLPANLTGNTDYLRMLDPVTGKLMPTVSSSCPANLLTASVKSEPLTEDDMKTINKDRQKKDNHNIIERKRRDNINNLIKELRTMLPHSSDPSKGSTLKATVDYLKELKKDRDRLKVVEERQKAYELQNRKLAMKVQELERLIEAHGIQLPLNSVDMTGMASLAPHLSALITGKGSPQPDSYPGTPTHQQPQATPNAAAHHFPSQNQYVQIKQEPAQSPIPQVFPQYMSMSLPEEFVGVNFSVTELANMMDTTEMDPMVSSLTNPFENFNMSEAQHLDMDFLT
ncbi:transcription factor E3-like isoform X2 [Paramacrobiotus metropolitanus]|uniref:transcription factor E3-like isoform X2 n=1 Tax=Paramacrobiotus metropolitanus TaxID=2943436 RepID=UPI002445BB23|nr:transcription factor E3-like isoform X2 [Paramacrobiotus metropolitanus]